MKIVRNIVIGIVILVVTAFVVVKVFVGAVNVPLNTVVADEKHLSQRITLPAGFKLSLYADDVPNARVLRFTKSGDLLVAKPNRNEVLLLPRDGSIENSKDGKADGQRVLLQDLNNPNGLDFYQDWLYIAETDAIGRVKFDHDKGELIGDYERIITDLPGGGNHWKKTLRFGADGWMYVSFGSSCNVCIEEDERRATMMRYQPDGRGEEVYATGLRNSAGFDWSPLDGSLYATDNGRDMLGDDFPPCELNKIKQGKFYGWPYVNGDNILDPDFGGRSDSDDASDEERYKISLAVSPAHEFKAHNAPLGIHFFRNNDSLPDEYKNSALVALHGSWNRSEKDGYKVVSLHWDSAGNITEKDFMTGFLKDDDVIGRPAEFEEDAEGNIYIADDFAGAIYRVSYR